MCKYIVRRLPDFTVCSYYKNYNNIKIKGMPIFTIVNGKVVMKENEIIEDGSGEMVEFSY